MSHRRAVFLLLLTIYVLFILDLAWFQFPSRNPTVNVVPFRTIVADWTQGGRDFVVNFLGNIVAFVPIGMVPRVVRSRRGGAGQAALFSLGLSLLIEGVQYASGRRYADVDDLILNTSGGVLGHFMLSFFPARRRGPAAFERQRPAGEG
jgi:glycopeptide antibiotics resistance protein